MAALVALSLSPLAPAGAARRAQVPLPSVQLPVALDWQPEYQGQVLCSDWAKPGAIKIADLLRRTYGRYITYITRSCDSAGTSEHEEGRAVDWMVDSASPKTRAKAMAFLKWVTAPGPNGQPAAMARRLGIMYLIYRDRMWRAYRPQDGWQEYNGCFSRQSDSLDTWCHRDHVHISLTWDGAYAKTSFWTGRAEDRPPCPSSSVSRPNGSPSRPNTLINTDTGKGVRGKRCRLAADTSYASRSYSIRVPVPRTTNGQRPVQRVQLKAFDLDAPVGVTIRSARRISIPQGTTPGGVFEIPLSSDGVIHISVDAGYSQLWLVGLGAGAPNGLPPGIDLSADRPQWLVNLPYGVSGSLKNPPIGAKLSVQRRLEGSTFRKVAKVPAIMDRFDVSTPAVTTPGVYEYRVALRRAGQTLARSPIKRVRVYPPLMTLNQPAAVRAGEKAVLAGGILGAPLTGAQMLVQVRQAGQSWLTVRRTAVANGNYRTRKRFAARGSYQVRTVLVSGTRVWVATAPRTLLVR